MEDFEALQIAGMTPSLLANRINIPVEAIKRLCRKIVVQPNGCWQWTGAKAKGYGVFKCRSVRASALATHRTCYELVHGRVDPKLDMHHKVEDGCIGRACCNPNHLLPVTRQEHLVELSPENIAFINAKAKACANGHPYTLESTRISKEGFRQCRICDKEWQQAKRDAARGDRPKGKWADHKRKKYCKRGHPLFGDNAYYIDTKWGKSPSCKLCRKLNWEEYVRRKKGAGQDSVVS